MVKLKNILSELLIAEAIPYSVAKEYLSIKRNPSIKKRIDDIFRRLVELPNVTFSKNRERIYIPFTGTGVMKRQAGQNVNDDEDDDGQIDSPESDFTTEFEVMDALKGTGFQIDDYVKGFAKDKAGRQISLQKALTRLGKTDLVNKVNRDPRRELSQQQPRILVFSKHPYDIAGASTGRGWTSCMNLYKGSQKKYLSADIEEGSIICYLTKKDDININKATARVFIKPFINVKNEEDVYYSAEESVYGTAPESFLVFVKEILTEVQPEKAGNFELVSTLYCDSSEKITKFGKRIEQILNGTSEAESIEEVYKIMEMFTVRGTFKVNADLTVDVFGDISLREKNLSRIPVQFGVVTGKFDCAENFMDTLEGAPRQVDGHFICNNNGLKSLKGGPDKVGGDFICHFNQLTNLVGAPSEIGGSFQCNINKLKTLIGGPKKVGKVYSVDNNYLITLKGAPEQVETFRCSLNQLTSLKGGPTLTVKNYFCDFNNLKTLSGCPSKITHNFYCNNNELTNLVGGPKEVGNVYIARKNKLTSLEGAPEKVGGVFNIIENPNLPDSEKKSIRKNPNIYDFAID
jgi:hypothetical protein